MARLRGFTVCYGSQNFTARLLSVGAFRELAEITAVHEFFKVGKIPQKLIYCEKIKRLKIYKAEPGGIGDITAVFMAVQLTG
jgi:hypothetical protein